MLQSYCDENTENLDNVPSPAKINGTPKSVRLKKTAVNCSTL